MHSTVAHNPRPRSSHPVAARRIPPHSQPSLSVAARLVPPSSPLLPSSHLLTQSCSIFSPQTSSPPLASSPLLRSPRRLRVLRRLTFSASRVDLSAAVVASRLAPLCRCQSAPDCCWASSFDSYSTSSTLASALPSRRLRFSHRRTRRCHFACERCTGMMKIPDRSKGNGSY